MHVEKVIGVQDNGMVVLASTNGHDHLLSLWADAETAEWDLTLPQGTPGWAAVIDHETHQIYVPGKQTNAHIIHLTGAMHSVAHPPGRILDVDKGVIITTNYSSPNHSVFSSCCGGHQVTQTSIPPLRAELSNTGLLAVSRRVARANWPAVTDIYVHKTKGRWQYRDTVIGIVSRWESPTTLTVTMDRLGVFQASTVSIDEDSFGELIQVHQNYAQHVIYPSTESGIPIIDGYHRRLATGPRTNVDIACTAPSSDLHIGSTLTSRLRAYRIADIESVTGEAVPTRWKVSIGNETEIQLKGLSLPGTKDEVAIILIGGPGQRVLDSYHPLAAALHNRGYTVWVPVLAGYDGSEKERNERLHQNWGSADLAEMNGLIREARKRFGAVHIIGHSYGAFLGLLSANNTGGEPDTVCAIAPFTSPEDLWENIPSSRILLRRWGYNSSNIARSPRFNIDSLEEASARVQIITLSRDRVTPITNDLERTLMGAKRSHRHEHHHIDGDHRAVEDATISEINSRVLEFLDSGGTQ